MKKPRKPRTRTNPRRPAQPAGVPKAQQAKPPIQVTMQGDKPLTPEGEKAMAAMVDAAATAMVNQAAQDLEAEIPREFPRSMSKDLFAMPSSSEAVGQTEVPPRSSRPEADSAGYYGRRAIEAGMERTLEELDGQGGMVDVGQAAPRGDYQSPEGGAHKTLSDRTREAKGIAPPQPAVQPMTMDELARQHARSISNDLHMTDARGRNVPTLADRVRVEGVKAQLQPPTPAPQKK